MSSKASQTSKSSQTTTDARVGASDEAVAVGQGATISFNQEFPKEAENIVLGSFDVVKGAGDILTRITESSQKLAEKVANTSQSALAVVAERQKTEETGFQIQDFLPAIGIGAAALVLITLIRM